MKTLATSRLRRAGADPGAAVRTRRRLALAALVFLFAALALAGCGTATLAATTAPASPPSLVGSWRAADTAGKAASLSDLTIARDGHFRYAGKNALGGAVAFTGTYRQGVDAGTPWIALVYDDYPDSPKVWFYKLEGDRLSVSAVRGDIANGSALVFTRQ